MRQETNTYLVYNNGIFSHDNTSNVENRRFQIQFDTHSPFFSLKAVNHNYEDVLDDYGSASGSGIEPLDNSTELIVTNGDCYFGFTADGKPQCYSTNHTANGNINYHVLFFSDCFPH